MTMHTLQASHLRAGTLLNGRLHYEQFAQGYRTGIEPILLAAALPARNAQTIIDVGCGAGPSLLCLNARNPTLRCIGIEADPATALLARRNLRLNGIKRDQSHVLLGRAPSLPTQLRHMAPNANGRFHHVISNPPWYAPDGKASPDARRNLALRTEHITPEEWLTCLTKWVLPGGTLTTILHSSLTDRACMTLRQNGCGSIKLFPLWPRPQQEAKLVIIQAIFAGKAAFRMLPGLVLHTAQNSFTPEADSILRDGAPLTL
nr:methyltransferase [uncultured Neokomagataea sp.]